MAQEATLTSGFGAELAALVQEHCFYHLEAPAARVAGWDTPYPHAQEWEYFPGSTRVGRALVETMEAWTMGEHVIKPPDGGEGAAEAELVEWHAKVGDPVREDQVLAAVMTAHTQLFFAATLGTGPRHAIIAPSAEGADSPGGIMSITVARRLAAALSLAVLIAPAAHAGDVTFQIRNGHPNAMRVELYSQDRDYVWPGDGKDFYLDDGETKQLPISCNEGEKICYGAWVDGDEETYWGVGPNNQENCEDCCYTCSGGQTEEIDLEE